MANTDQKLKVSELDFIEIKNNLKNFLRDQQEFTDFDFEASGMNILLDILAYNTHYMAFYNNMIGNEMFLDTAILRDSVVSHAKMLGYTPLSSVAPRAKIDLQINRPVAGPLSTATNLTLPRFTRFLSSPVDTVSYTFVNPESAVGEYDPTCGRFCFHDLFIKEGEPLTYTFTYDATNNTKQTFELPDAGIDTSTIEVLVQESTTSLKTQKHILATDATTVSNTSPVYYIEESRNGKYKIYFGEGIIGKTLTNGNVIIVTYIKTNGSAANKANSFTLIESVNGLSSHVIFPKVAASGGTGQEPIEKIRTTAPKAYISNNRGVTTDDLIAIVNKNYPYFESINIWGGEDNDPPVYGKVFIAAKPTLGYEITESEKLTVINDVIKPYSVVTVIPEFVDVDYNYVNVLAEVTYNPTETTRSPDGIKSVVRSAILTYANDELNDFNSQFKMSKMLRAIDDSDQSINFSDATCTITKRFVPQVGAARNYTLNFGTPIAREDPKYKVYSTPAFYQFDEEGVYRKCFLEETPGTSSGIEGINIVAAPNLYENIPTIVIQGDGVGANAYPVIVNGKVTEVVVDYPGINYTTATALLYYNDELDTTAKFNVLVQGRFGTIRSYYFDNNNVKFILNPEAGSIDYKEGKITLIQFDPAGIEDPLRIFKVTAKPATNSFESARSRIITIDGDDPSSINIEAKTVR